MFMFKRAGMAGCHQAQGTQYSLVVQAIQSNIQPVSKFNATFKFNVTIEVTPTKPSDAIMLVLVVKSFYSQTTKSGTLLANWSM